MDEFTIIQRYFMQRTTHTSIAALNRFLPRQSIGDDAAVLPYNRQFDLAMTTDTLVESVHFLEKHPPRLLGKRALAVNLSDLAAMGATPHWYVLSLTLPQAKPAWLKAFSQGLHQYAKTENSQLVGGNITQGALSISITALGLLPRNHAILRSGAQYGDDVWITGMPGMAALGLALLQKTLSGIPIKVRKMAIEAYQAPTPPIAFGRALHGMAHAMIDVSDGLWQDAVHIARSSNVGLVINIDQLPPFPSPVLSMQAWRRLQLTGGDDYSLLFTAAASKHDHIQRLARKHNVAIYPIGGIRKKPNGVVLYDQGRPIIKSVYQNIAGKFGYQHF